MHASVRYQLLITLMAGIVAGVSIFNARTVTGQARINDVAAAGYDVRAFGAIPDDGINDRTRIQDTINAAETAGGGRVVIPGPGVYDIIGATTDRQLMLVTRSVEIECTAGAVLRMSVPGADTVPGLRVSPPAGSGGSYNVISKFVLRGCILAPVAGSEPGGVGLYLDTTVPLTQIRNAVIENNHIGTPTAEFGSWGISMANTNNDGQFTNYFNWNWIYGGINLDKVGDSIHFFGNTITSNVQNRPFFSINMFDGAIGPLVFGGNYTGGGGVIIHSARNVLFQGANFELANSALTTAAVTPAIVQVRGGGYLTRVKRATFRDCTFRSTITGVHGLIVDRADKTVIETNEWGITGAPGSGTDPIYALNNTTLRLVTATTNALATNTHGSQEVRDGSTATNFFSNNDPGWTYTAVIGANAYFTLAGRLGLTEGVKIGGVGGTELLHGAGSPEGVKSACPGSIYMRSDGGARTSMYVKESTGSCGNTGWVAK